MEKDKEVNYCDDCSNMVVNIEHISDCDRGTTTRRRCLAKPFNDHYAKKSDNSRFMMCDDVRLQVGSYCALFTEKKEETKELEPSICVQCGSFHNVGMKANGEYFVMGRQCCGRGPDGGFKTREEAIIDWEKRNVKEDEEEPLCSKCGNRHPVELRLFCETNRYYDGPVAIKRLPCLFCGETHLPGVGGRMPSGYLNGHFVAATKKCKVSGPVKSSMVEAVKAWNKMHSVTMSDDRSAWKDEWPTEEGEYWFHGWTCNFDRNRKKELLLVKCIPLSNSITYVVDGHFMYKSEGAEGKWLKAILPELPKED